MQSQHTVTAFEDDHELFSPIRLQEWVVTQKK